MIGSHHCLWVDANWHSLTYFSSLREPGCGRVPVAQQVLEIIESKGPPSGRAQQWTGTTDGLLRRDEPVEEMLKTSGKLPIIREENYGMHSYLIKQEK